LANVLLDEVDKELERRGHAFVRYADDLNVYVRSQRLTSTISRALPRVAAESAHAQPTLPAPMMPSLILCSVVH
jgi:hypothetical protein